MTLTISSNASGTAWVATVRVGASVVSLPSRASRTALRALLLADSRTQAFPRLVDVLDALEEPLPN